MGLLVVFGQIYDPAINAAALAFDRALRADLPDGVIETVPTFRSVLVRFEPLEISCPRLEGHLQELLARQDWLQAEPDDAAQHWVLPCVYGGARGPDLGKVADLMGRREDQVVAAHAAVELRVAMLGFSPGLAYLGQLPEAWNLARRSTLTPEVPAGSVLVAVRQTVLPATPIPTGWHAIGQTPFRAFVPAHRRPFLLAPGDRLRFEPVAEPCYAAFDQADFLRKSGG